MDSIRSYMTNLGALLAILATSASAFAEQTQCAWKNSRDGVNFEAISSFKQLTTISDCVNALGVTILVTEPNRGSTTYNGTFLLKDSRGDLIATCISETVRPMTEEEIGVTMTWLYQNRAGYSDMDFLQLLRTQPWQDLIKHHMHVSCTTPVS